MEAAIRSSSESTEVVLRRVVSGTRREEERTVCYFNNGGSILLPNFLGALIRSGDAPGDCDRSHSRLKEAANTLRNVKGGPEMIDLNRSTPIAEILERYPAAWQVLIGTAWTKREVG